MVAVPASHCRAVSPFKEEGMPPHLSMKPLLSPSHVKGGDDIANFDSEEARIVAGITNRGGEGGHLHRHSRYQRRPSALNDPPPPNPSYRYRQIHRGCRWRSVMNAAAT
ncbi:hypothetical protein AHAS_Ahas01G0101000 [Arachis hypogaea]